MQRGGNDSIPMVAVRNLSMRFGKVDAVRDVSFDVPAGTILGLVGSDGAGKSTLLRMIATMMRPTGGRIFVNGLDVATRAGEVKRIIGYMPQRFGLYQDLTVGENIDFFMDIFGIPSRERRSRKEKYLGFSNLLSFQDRLAGNLSGGMKQKLGLACVLVHEPGVLVLDEPTNGVDPLSRRELWDILTGMRREGMTILVSTAYLDEGELCDRLALMHRSVLLEVSTPVVMRGDSTTIEEAVIARIADMDGEDAHDTFRY